MVLDLGHEHLEEGRGGGDKAHRGGHAGQDDDGRKDGLADGAHGEIGGVGKQGRSRLIGLAVRDSLAHPGQAQVDCGQQKARNKRGGDGAVDQGLAGLKTLGAQGRNNHDGKGQAGNRVHGVIALEQAGDHGGRRIILGRGLGIAAVAKSGQSDKDDQQRYQGWGKELAQGIDDGVRAPGQH